MPGTGNLATFGLSASTEPTCITKITMPEFTIEDLETSCLNTTTYKTYVKSNLADPGEITIDFIVSNLVTPLIPLGVAEVVTVNFGITTAGNAVKATFIADGYVSKVKIADQENGVLQTGSLTFKLNGEDTEPAFTLEAVS